jgi:hypothetical protein
MIKHDSSVIYKEENIGINNLELLYLVNIDKISAKHVYMCTKYP